MRRSVIELAKPRHKLQVLAKNCAWRQIGGRELLHILLLRMSCASAEFRGRALEELSLWRSIRYELRTISP